MARDSYSIIQDIFAESGDVGLGALADMDEGWPIVYEQDGGSSPERIQMNLFFRNLYSLAVEINQQGPYLQYDASIDYAIGASVSVSAVRYRALIANGPTDGVVSPVGDLTGTWVLDVIGLPQAGDFIFLPYEPTTTQLAARKMLQGNGGSVLDADYPDILTAWGGSKIYGNVDSTHFNLPNLSGYFPRFFDDGAGVDSDAASRTDRGDGTTGDEVGTTQPEQVGSHRHTLSGDNTLNLDTEGDYRITSLNTSYTEDGITDTRPKNIAIWGGILY